MYHIYKWSGKSNIDDFTEDITDYIDNFLRYKTQKVHGLFYLFIMKKLVLIKCVIKNLVRINCVHAAVRYAEYKYNN